MIAWTGTPDPIALVLGPLLGFAIVWIIWWLAGKEADRIIRKKKDEYNHLS